MAKFLALLEYKRKLNNMANELKLLNCQNMKLSFSRIYEMT